MWIDLFDEIVNNNSKFIISTHVNPDGDAIGSSMALYHHLKDRQKEVYIINYSSTSKYYQFLDSDSIIIKYNESEREKIMTADIIFLLDLNDLSRVKSLSDIVMSSPAKKVIIDHHLPNVEFYDYGFTDENACATGEILYRLFTRNGKLKLSKKISEAIYTALMTDTLSFHLPKATSEVYRMAANLIDWGADQSNIYYQVYERNDINRFHLLGNVINSFKIFHNGQILYMVVNQKSFVDTGTSEPDIDNFIDYGLRINGVKVVIFFVELKDGVKISFRSRGDIAINEVAKLFNGNGHRNAAGARLFNTSLTEVMPAVFEKVKLFLS